MVMRLAALGLGGWNAAIIATFVAGAGCGSGAGSACGSSGPGGTAACAPSAPPSAESFGDFSLPPGATLLEEELGAGHEGAGYGRAWAMSPCSIDEVAAWLNHGDRGVTQETTSAAPLWRSAEGLAIGVFADRESAGAPEGAPTGTETWFSLCWDVEPTACPPCPEGFEGTLLPSCECP